MPLVTSYHSNTPGEKVYHNHSGCKEGNKIDLKNRIHGVGKLLLRCAVCGALANTNK